MIRPPAPQYQTKTHPPNMPEIYHICAKSSPSARRSHLSVGLVLCCVRAECRNFRVCEFVRTARDADLPRRSLYWRILLCYMPVYVRVIQRLDFIASSQHLLYVGGGCRAEGALLWAIINVGTVVRSSTPLHSFSFRPSLAHTPSYDIVYVY